jgi:hypothetical protein
MKLLKKAEKSKDFWFLLIASFVFFLLRFPSLFEPYWYGDEGIYEVLGSAIREGRVLYEGIFDNKPPFLYLTYAIFDGDQFWARILSLVFGIGAITIFYFLAKKLFGEGKEGLKIVMWSTGIFGFLFGLPIVEGNIANAENFMLLPILLSAILIFKEKANFKTYLFAGFLLGIAFLFKIVAIFDLAAFTFFVIAANLKLSERKVNLPEIARQVYILVLPIALGFITPVLLTSLFFIGSPFKYFAQATFFQNVGYVGHGNKLIIPQGFLILKLMILTIYSAYLFLRRDKFSKTALFILIWLGFSLFNTFFAQRPYTHYLLVLIPSFALLIGLISFEKRYKIQAALLFVIVLFLVLLNFNLYGKTPFYYQNFVSFISGSKSVSDYRSFFDRKTPGDYQIADYINTKTDEKDNIFIWGNNAQVYKLTDKLPPGRYTVAYHITGYKDGVENTKQAIEIKKPKYIIIMPNMPQIPFSLAEYGNAMQIEKAIIYERVF